MHLAVQHRIKLRLENVLKYAELGLFLRLEGTRVFQHFAVAVAKNVRREPPVEPQHTRLESGGENSLHQRLPGLEILAADWNAMLQRKLLYSRNIHSKIRGAVGEGNAAGHRSPSVKHRGCDSRMI